VTAATVKKAVLEITDLGVDWQHRRGPVPILDGVTLSIASGETVALVGESGAGKSMLALAVMSLLPDGIRIARGSIALDGDELVGATPAAIRDKRGGQMAMIFQDPLSSLHPAFRVGDQITETLRTHGTCATKRDARARAVELLGLVGVPQPDARARDHPHQLSGGMRQRVMIAMAIANDPHLLIADEATTALDVTVQAQVLDVLRDAQRRTGAALLLVTHDLGVVAGVADRVVVLYAGRVVEEGPVADVLAAPAHPYTRGLMRAVPRLGVHGDGTGLTAISGQPPNPGAWPSGCAFHPRCERADDRCQVDVPVLARAESERARAVACHHPLIEWRVGRQ
jgi:oligopeptide/dipeptide ABC transporter ATP-binding protein